MWRNLAKRAASKKLKCPSNTTTYCKDSNFIEKITPPETQTLLNSPNPLLAFRRIGVFTCHDCGITSSPLGIFCRGYGTAAARAISSTDESDFSGADELQEPFEQHNKQQEKIEPKFRPQQKKMVAGISIGKYHMLKRRQMKMETEAWQAAAQEYQEMLEDMCARKLGPNLPYVKSLFLGWFEPLNDAIAKEQEACLMNKRRKSSHGPYFNELTADMMAVITMHKLMALLMSGNGGKGTVRVVQAATAVCKGIVTEARIHKE